MIEFRRNKETGLLEAIKDGEYVGVIYTMGDFISEEPVILGNPRRCPKCGGFLVDRQGYSKFLGCTNYPKCDYIQALNK